MLTLCRLDAPVSVRPPESLKAFKFFMTRARRKDGQQDIYLHMGYFPTLVDAQKWTQVMRAKYPQALASPTPAALLRSAASPTPAHTSARRPPMAEPPVLRRISPAEGNALTDTQVLNILENRRVDGDGRSEQDRPEIPLLRPEDTNTRRILKEAVIQGAPVSFVVQLHHSSQPIDLGGVPSLDVFRAYTLYAAEGRHEGNPLYSLRLGFFKDAIAAKQVAHYVQGKFKSVCVVPIHEEECARAKKQPISLARLGGNPLQNDIDALLAADQSATAPADRAPTTSVPALSNTASMRRPEPVRKQPAPTERQPRAKDSLEQTLELLASSEIWNNPDALEETGVRHLKVEIQKRR